MGELTIEVQPREETGTGPAWHTHHIARKEIANVAQRRNVNDRLTAVPEYLDHRLFVALQRTSLRDLSRFGAFALLRHGGRATNHQQQTDTRPKARCQLLLSSIE